MIAISRVQWRGARFQSCAIEAAAKVCTLISSIAESPGSLRYWPMASLRQRGRRLSRLRIGDGQGYSARPGSCIMARLRSRVPTSLSVENVQAIPRAGLALSSLGVLKKGSHRGGAGADLQYRRAWPHRHPRGVQPSRQKWRGSGIRPRHDALQPPLWRLRPQTKSLRRSDREGAFLCDQGAARQLRYVRRTENRSFRTCITRRRCAIDGLYAAGNDQSSVMGGHYPSGGINLGPAMTFGFVAGRHAAGTFAK